MNQTLNVNQEILNIFQGFRMAPTAIDQYDAIGRNVLSNKLDSFISNNRPIDFVMLGFPMKSPNNKDKVLGTLPDLAEEVAFKNFGDFNEKIKAVYSPRVRFSIGSDGYVFSDIMGVKDQTVADYEAMSIAMAKSVAPVEFFDLNSFFKNGLIDDKRDQLMKQFGLTEEALTQRILLDADTNSLYKGMIKFLSLDLAIYNYPSNAQLHKAAKIVAREMMSRNEAYSRLVSSEFDSHIRLSMHPSINNGTKFSFQLIPSKKAWTSPWHCSLLIDEVGDYATIHRRDAEAAGYQLIYKDGRPYNFQA